MEPHAISQKYATAVERTLESAMKVPADRRDEPGVCGDWSLKDLMGHLTYWDSVNRYEMETEQAGGTIISDDRDDDTINAEQAEARKDWSWDQIMAEVIDNRDARVELHKRPSRYDQSGAGEHWDEHRAQIDAWLAANIEGA